MTRVKLFHVGPVSVDRSDEALSDLENQVNEFMNLPNIETFNVFGPIPSYGGPSPSGSHSVGFGYTVTYIERLGQ